MKKQFTDQLSKLRLAIILPLLALAPAASIIAAAPASADTNNWTYVDEQNAHSASCSTLSLPSVTVAQGDLVVVFSSAKGTPAAGLPSDSQSNTYTADTSAAAGTQTARSTSTAWAIASSSGSLTVTVSCVSSNANARVGVWRPASGTTVAADSNSRATTGYGTTYNAVGFSASADNELLISSVFGTNSPATLIQPWHVDFDCTLDSTVNSQMDQFSTFGGVGAGESQISWNGPNGSSLQTTTTGNTAGVCWKFQNYVNGSWVDTTQPYVATLLGFTAS